MYLCKYVNIYIYVYFVYMCICKCIRMCICMCMCVCVRICTCFVSGKAARLFACTFDVHAYLYIFSLNFNRNQVLGIANMWQIVTSEQQKEYLGKVQWMMTSLNVAGQRQSLVEPWLLLGSGGWVRVTSCWEVLQL